MKMAIIPSGQVEEDCLILPPWEVNPSFLISWWSMEKFSADLFLAIARYLANVRTRLEKLGPPGTKIESGYFQEGSSGHSNLTGIKNSCQKIGLSVSVKSVTHMLQLKEGDLTLGAYIEKIAQIERTILWEMEDRLFMYIPPTRAIRYELVEPFGTEFSKNFPSAVFDAKEAGNCFASGRYTATVFHLMRVLEIGLVSFAKIFPAVPVNKENWQQIIEKIESEIRALPSLSIKAADWKEKQEKYSQLANNFMFFKDAWRNYTAHARGKYTEDEADAIYRNVHAFMKGLAIYGISE